MYHRLTRRVPNRRSQWGEIGELRPHGSVGHPTAALTLQAPQFRRVSRSLSGGTDFEMASVEDLELLPEPPQGAPEPAAGTAALATMTALMFLLACAYAAFSGYSHSYDNKLAYLAILGSVGCLMAAGAGIGLAALGLGCRASVRFLALCAGSFAAMYGMMLFFAATTL